MDKENKYYDFIKNSIIQHRKFPGLESILEEIIDDVFEHSAIILNSVDDENVIKSYISKIISTSIVTVPKRFNVKKEPINTIEKRELLHNIETLSEKRANKEFVDKMINMSSEAELHNDINENIEVEDIVSDYISQKECSDDTQNDIEAQDSVDEEAVVQNDTIIEETETSENTDSIDAILDFDSQKISEEDSKEDDANFEDTNPIYEENEDVRFVADEEMQKIEKSYFKDNSLDEMEYLEISLPNENALEDTQINEYMDSESDNQETQNIDDENFLLQEENEEEIVNSNYLQINEIVEESDDNFELVEPDFVSEEEEKAEDSPQEYESTAPQTFELENPEENSEPEIVMENDTEILSEEPAEQDFDSQDFSIDYNTEADFEEEINIDNAINENIEDTPLEEPIIDSTEDINFNLDLDLDEEDKQNKVNYQEPDYSVFKYNTQNKLQNTNLEQLAMSLDNLNTTNPNLQVHRIFEMRYNKKMTILDIALELNTDANSIVEILNSINALV